MLISLRIQDELMVEIDRLAESDGRSRNSFIVRALEGMYGNGRVDGSESGSSVGGGGDGTGVSVVRKAEGDKKLLHPVQPLRGELAGRGDAPAQLLAGPAGGSWAGASPRPASSPRKGCTGCNSFLSPSAFRTTDTPVPSPPPPTDDPDSDPS